MSVRAIAEHLTKRKVPSPRGGPWSQVTVSRMLQRIERSNRPERRFRN
jgi:Recombinase